MLRVLQFLAALLLACVARGAAATSASVASLPVVGADDGADSTTLNAFAHSHERDVVLDCDAHPSQFHLSLVRDHSSMALSWTRRCVIADVGERAFNGSRTTLHALMHAPEGNWTDAPDAIVTFWPRSDTVTRPQRARGVRSKRYFLSEHFRALLAPLRANTAYCYAVDGTAGGCFRTPPSDPLAPVTFASLGDMGTNNSAGTIAGLAARARAGALAFVMHGGDIGYGDDLGFPRAEQSKRPTRANAGALGYEAVYDDFMAQLAPVASAVPYMVAPGNHDVSCNILTDLDCARGQRNFSAYRTRFRMPSRESGAGARAQSTFYSFRRGRVHVAVINTEADYPRAPTQPWTRVGGGRGGGFGDQLAWLERDLAAARRGGDGGGGDDSAGAADWVVVVGHRQLYASQRLNYPLHADATLRSAVEDVLARHAVDLYIGAHVHYYERWQPVRAGVACAGAAERDDAVGADVYSRPACTVHVTNGAGGNCEGAQARGPDSEMVAAGVYGDFGYAVVDVPNATHLQWRFFATSGAQERLADEFWIVK